ncbi:MAG: hypothetical protein AB7L66_19750 [Gemmatimonadales bacterium]
MLVPPVLPALSALLAVAGIQNPDAFKRALSADTTEVGRAARRAQENFERDRRLRLPASYGSSGRCDERIGRFCYWYDDGDTTLPADPPSVKDARRDLIAVLGGAAARQPEHDWLTGQHVRYLVEQDLLDAGVTTARGCRATPWWCAALEGYATHAAGRYAAADSAFDRALALAPEPIRCAWLDWSVVLDERLAGRVEEGSCAERVALADTVFWLGQPLLSRPGNDLRTEYLSRRVVALLRSTARTAYGTPWGDDMEELLLRYGWSTRYSVAGNTARALEGPSVIGHQRSPAFQFLPVTRADTGLEAWEWTFKPERPRSRYAPPYADEFLATTHYQVARFPRGDTTLVAAALGATLADPGFRGRPLDQALAVSTGSARTVITRRDSTRTPGAFLLAVPPSAARSGQPAAAAGGGTPPSAAEPGAPLLVSLETNPHGIRRFLRARTLVAPIDRTTPLVLSDPLLFQAADELPRSLDEAVPRMLATDRVSRKAPVGVYWETAGPAGDSVSVSIALVPFQRGLLGRIGQGLSLVGRRAPLTLEWQAGAAGERITGRALELDLRRLKNGRYRLVIELTGPAGSATSERTIELVP